MALGQVDGAPKASFLCTQALLAKNTRPALMGLEVKPAAVEGEPPVSGLWKALLRTKPLTLLWLLSLHVVVVKVWPCAVGGLSVCCVLAA